jgi:hypothetical protein
MQSKKPDLKVGDLVYVSYDPDNSEHMTASDVNTLQTSGVLWVLRDLRTEDSKPPLTDPLRVYRSLSTNALWMWFDSEVERADAEG